MNDDNTKVPLTKQDIMELVESVEVIQEITFGLREEIEKHIQKDNPDIGTIDFMISQIYDQAFTASMHAFTLMQQCT